MSEKKSDGRYEICLSVNAFWHFCVTSSTGRKIFSENFENFNSWTDFSRKIAKNIIRDKNFSEECRKKLICEKNFTEEFRKIYFVNEFGLKYMQFLKKI